MLQNPFTFVVKQMTNKMLITSLLRRQGLEFIQNAVFHYEVLDLMDENPLVFNTSSIEILQFAQKLLQKKNSQTFSTKNSDSRVAITLNKMESNDSESNNLLYLNLFAKMKAMHLKIYTIFNRKLTSQKIGTKSKNRIYLFSDENNNFVLLQKSSSFSVLVNAKKISLLASSAFYAKTHSTGNSGLVVGPEQTEVSSKPYLNSLKCISGKTQRSEWACFTDDLDSGTSFVCSKFVDYCDENNSDGSTSIDIQETSADCPNYNCVCQKIQEISSTYNLGTTTH